MNKFKKLFQKHEPVIGMIHIDALPGTPKNRGSIQRIIEHAVEDADIYYKSGISAVAIENMHDVPYLKKHVGPETTSVMSVVGYEIKKRFDLICGIQILAGANKEALAAAHAAGLDFIRAEGFVFAHTADEGIIESDAGELLRYRKNIGAENVLIFTDIKKKHSSHSITSDISIQETAKAAEFFLSDGLIITGIATGYAADQNEIEKVKMTTRLPVIAGSGVAFENVEKYYDLCDGLIVGSYFKKNGQWENRVDEKRVKLLLDKIRSHKN